MSLIQRFTDNVSYTSRDINQLRSKLINLIMEEVPNWSDFSDSDLGMVMLDVFTGCVDYAQYFLDRQANEVYLDRATELKNIQSIATTIGYKIPLAHSAEGEVVFALSYILDTDLKIPKYTQVSTDDSSSSLLYFAVAKDSVIKAGTSYASVPVVQGRVKELQVSKTELEKSYKYYLEETNIADSCFEISDDDGLFTEVDDAFLEVKGGRYYSVQREGDLVYILFTWDMVDRIATTSTYITIKYLLTDGADGNVTNYLVSNLVSTIYKDGVNISNNIAVRNITEITGGSDSPDAYSIIVNAKKNLRSMGRYITLTDYQEAVESYPSIYKSVVNDWSSENSFVSSPYQVIAKVISKDGMTFSDTFLDNMSTAINSKGVCSTQFKAEQAELHNFTIDLYFTAISSNYDYRNTLEEKVKNALNDAFGYGKLEFGETVTITQIKDIVYSQSNTINLVEVTYPEESLTFNKDIYPYAGVINVALKGDYYGNL